MDVTVGNRLLMTASEDLTRSIDVDAFPKIRAEGLHAKCQGETAIKASSWTFHCNCFVCGSMLVSGKEKSLK